MAIPTVIARTSAPRHAVKLGRRVFPPGTGNNSPNAIIAVTKEEYDEYEYLLEKISTRMDKGEYPIFVTAGDGRQKLSHIKHNEYLTFCYENLCNTKGSLVTFGFGFGEYDEHIIDAINRAANYGRKSADKLWSLYIGVNSDSGKKHIEKISSKFKTQPPF